MEAEQERSRLNCSEKQKVGSEAPEVLTHPELI